MKRPSQSLELPAVAVAGGSSVDDQAPPSTTRAALPPRSGDVDAPNQLAHISGVKEGTP